MAKAPAPAPAAEPVAANPWAPDSAPAPAPTDAEGDAPEPAEESPSDEEPEAEPAEEVIAVSDAGEVSAFARFNAAKDTGDAAAVKEAAEALMREFPAEDQAAIAEHLEAAALVVIEKFAKGNKARREAALMVDGTVHYGTRRG
jgi:ribonuclease E